jgi:hypothetical protein
MTCGLQDKNFAFYSTCDVCIYRMHIQDGGMYATFDQNKSIYFENNCKGSLYIILNVLSNKTNLIYIVIAL